MKYILFLDFDGTLAPIAKSPSKAIFPEATKKIIQKLSFNPKFRVAVISGRGLANIKELLKLKNIIYAGNHGYEINIYGQHWQHPKLSNIRPQMVEIFKILSNNIHIKGVIIEDKGATLSLHYRMVAKSDLPELRKIFRRSIKKQRKSVNITSGKKVWEVRPKLKWNKGEAVKMIIQRLKLKEFIPIYIGDDKTDEDAFKVLSKNGVTVKVGKGSKSLARHRLEDVKAVTRFLNNLNTDCIDKLLEARKSR